MVDARRRGESGAIFVSALVLLALALAVTASLRVLHERTEETYRCQARAVAEIGAADGSPGCPEDRAESKAAELSPPGLDPAAAIHEITILDQAELERRWLERALDPVYRQRLAEEQRALKETYDAAHERLDNVRKLLRRLNVWRPDERRHYRQLQRALHDAYERELEHLQWKLLEEESA